MDTEAEPDQLNVRDYVRMLRRRWRVIVLTMIVAVGGAIAVSVAQTKVYNATAEILVKTTPSQQVSSASSNADSQLNAQRNLDTELQVLQSRAVADTAKKQLGHAPDISVNQIGQTDVVSVTAQSTDPRQAARDARVYAQSYISTRRKQSVDDLLASVNEIQGRLNEVVVRLNALPLNSPERTALQSEADFFRNELGQFGVATGVAQVGGGTLVTPPTVPSSPAKPTPVKNGVIAAFIALLLGIALAFLREYLDDSVKTKSDLEVATKVPVLGLVPTTPGWKKVHQSHVVAREQPNSVAAESYRTLRTAVQFLCIDEPIHVLQITSATSAEGKTTTLANLATTLAQAKQRVIVIDCDLRRPRLHEFFGLDNSVGFTSVLLGVVPLSKALRAAPNDPHVAVLTSGPRPPDPSEVLLLQPVGRIFDTLRDRCDIVLVDSPPVIPVTDPLIVSKYVDATLIIAKAGVTSKRSLHRAVEILQQVDAPIVGTVLNDIRARIGSYEYAYAAGGNAYGGRRASRYYKQVPATGSPRSSLDTEVRAPQIGATLDSTRAPDVDSHL